MFTRYFYPLNEQEDSCSVHLNGMTDVGHTFTKKILNEHRADLWDFGGI